MNGGKRAEIYTYEAPWMIYACNWSVRIRRRRAMKEDEDEERGGERRQDAPRTKGLFVRGGMQTELDGDRGANRGIAMARRV